MWNDTFTRGCENRKIILLESGANVTATQSKVNTFLLGCLFKKRYQNFDNFA